MPPGRAAGKNMTAFWAARLKHGNANRVMQGVNPASLMRRVYRASSGGSHREFGPLGCLAMVMVEEGPTLFSLEKPTLGYLLEWAVDHLPESEWQHESLRGIPDRDFLFSIVNFYESVAWTAWNKKRKKGLPEKLQEAGALMERLNGLIPERFDRVEHLRHFIKAIPWTDPSKRDTTQINLNRLAKTFFIHDTWPDSWVQNERAIEVLVKGFTQKNRNLVDQTGLLSDNLSYIVTLLRNAVKTKPILVEKWLTALLLATTDLTRFGFRIAKGHDEIDEYLQPLTDFVTETKTPLKPEKIKSIIENLCEKRWVIGKALRAHQNATRFESVLEEKPHEPIEMRTRRVRL